MTENDASEIMISKDEDTKDTSFGVDLFKLVSGTSVSTALIVLATPILTRFYSPKAYGLYAVFAGITTTLTVISCLRYELSIMLPESDDEAANLMIGSVLISFLMALFTLPVVWFGKSTIPQLLNAPELESYLWLVPLTVMLGGTTVGHPALNYWSTRTKHFGWLSFARIFGTGFIVSLQIIAGILGYTTGGSLILSSVIGGGIISTLVLGVQIWILDRKFLIKSASWAKIIQGLKRYYKFPLFDSWAALLNVISSQLPTFFFSIYFSAAITGFYSLGNRMLKTPLNVVGNSIGQVFFQRAAEGKNNGTLHLIVENTFYYLVTIGMFPFLILTVIGKDLFIVIFGNSWAEAGVYAQILSIWIVFMFISSPMSTLFRLLEMQKFSLKINIGILITRILSLVLGGMLGNPRIALLLFAGSGAIIYGYLSLISIKCAGVQITKMLKIVLVNLIRYIPAGISLFILVSIDLNSWLLVGLAVLMILVYYLLMIKTDAKVYEFLISTLRSFAYVNPK